MTDYRINNCLLNPGVWLLLTSNNSIPVIDKDLCKNTINLFVGIK